MTQNKILLLGGTGYIGSRLSKFLKDQDNYIHIVDICWFGNVLEKGVDYDELTVGDYKDLTVEFISEFNTVILLSAFSSVKMCLLSSLSSFRDSVANFVELLFKIEKISESKKIKFIYSSSSSVYGNAKSMYVTEDYPIDEPNNYYDLSKLVIDNYAKLSKVEYYSLRFGTLSGYSPNLRTDILLNSMVNNSIINGEVRLYVSDIYRPFLSTLDCCRAISTINSSDQDLRGIYNLVTWNDTVENYGQTVSSILSVPVKHFSLESIQTIENVKLQSKQYNFTISGEKFANTFGFVYVDTPETVIRELVDNFDKMSKGNRNISIDY